MCWDRKRLVLLVLSLDATIMRKYERWHMWVITNSNESNLTCDHVVKVPTHIWVGIRKVRSCLKMLQSQENMKDDPCQSSQTQIRVRRWCGGAGPKTSKIISSKYRSKKVVVSPCLKMNKEESDLPCVKLIHVINVANRWNHVLGACFKPTRDFYRRHIWFRWVESWNLRGRCM